MRKRILLAGLLVALVTVPAAAQKPAEGKQPGQGNANPTKSRPAEGKGLAGLRQLNVLSGVFEKLDLDDDQVAEVRLIVREFTEQARQQAGANGDPELAKKRQALIERLRSDGLQGPELRKAVQEAIGTAGRPAPGGRPQEILAQRQAELISKVRAVLNESQQEQLDELLKQRAADQQAKRQAREDAPARKRPEAGQKPAGDNKKKREVPQNKRKGGGKGQAGGQGKGGES